MIGLDTSVLVRYLVQDDALQSEKANRIIKKEKNLFINHIVLCELVWVLNRGYHYSKETTVDVLEKILQTKQFEIEHKHIIWSALQFFKETSADFADCLIAVINQQAGCDHTVSFDRKAHSLKHFK